LLYSANLAIRQSPDGKSRGQAQSKTRSLPALRRAGSIMKWDLWPDLFRPKSLLPTPVVKPDGSENV
jgi:hypothetical protein